MALNRAADRTEAAAWTVAGPPCPTLDAAGYRGLAVEQPQAFAFEGLRGERAHGDLTCNVVDLDHAGHTASTAVCEFTDPFAMRVATPRGDLYFKPGVAQPATLSLADGEVRCVMGARLDAVG